MRLQKQEAADLEIDRFKRMLIAVHPDKAGDLLKAMEAEENGEMIQRPFTDEELEMYAQERLSVEEVNDAIGDLRQFGLRLEA